MALLDRPDGSIEDAVERIAELELTVQRLREALWEEWEANHVEHCSREWPHPAGARCHWPLSDELAG